MNEFVSKNWTIFVLVIISLIAAFFYSYLSFTITGDIYAESGEKLIFNSPDETGNYFFSHLYSTEGKLYSEEPNNFYANGLISPRSMKFVNGMVVPASFFGLMLFLGFVGKIIGTNLIIFILPFLTALSLIYFYLLIKKIFNKEIAFFSTLLALTFPAYWYYATRSFFNNVFFLDLLIIGLFYLVLSLEKQKNFYYFLSALFLAGSLFIRTSELVWVTLLILLIFIFNRKSLRVMNLIIFISTTILVALPIFYYNQIIYGQLVSIGYGINLFISTDNILTSGVNLMGQIILPFGIHINNIYNNFYNYFINIFWWYFILFELGFAYLIIKILSYKKSSKITRSVILYFFLFTIISVCLIILYGSWRVVDNPDPNAVTLGTSYARYFLPIYIFSLPIISYSLFDLLKKFKNLKIIIGIFIFCLFYYFSFNLVFLDKEEGIFKIKSNIRNYQSIASEVINITEKESIIIAEKNDKIFFPARKVIYKLNNEKDEKVLDTLLDTTNIYWWRFQLNDDDLDYIKKINNEKGYQWFLDNSIYCFGNQCLYPLLKNNQGNVE